MEINPLVQGVRFERLEVIDFSHSEVYRNKNIPVYTCRCDCGSLLKIRKYSLTSGNTKSCGCLRKEVSAKMCFKHGKRCTKVYEVWKSMVQRCYNPNNKSYKNYGGRGIEVCKEWLNSFETFSKDMGERPEGATIERKDVNEGYFKENCRWEISRSVQSINRRKLPNNKSGHTGVCWNKKLMKWSVSLNIDKRRIYGGVFSDLDAAVEKRKELEEKHHVPRVGIREESK